MHRKAPGVPVGGSVNGARHGASLPGVLADRIVSTRAALVQCGRAHWRWFVVVAALLLLVGLPNYPGRWNTDTGVMVEQMQARRYDDVWSPFITWLWQPFYSLGVGAGWVMLGQVVVIALSVGVVFRRLGVPGAWAPPLTFALCISPVFYASAISVMRDTWFLCALLVAIACVLSPYGRRTMALLVVAVVLAIATRQNAAPAVAVVVAWAAWRWGPWVGRTRVLAAVGSGVVAPVVVLLSLAVWESAIGVDQEHPETAVFVGDLDEMSGRVGQMLMPESVVDPPFTLDEFRTSTIYALDTLWFYDQRASLRQTDSVHAEIAEAWRDAVREYPVVYLHGRWKLFTRQIGWSGPPAIAYFPADIGTSRSPTPHFPAAAERASTYLSWFTQEGDWRDGGLVHRAWVWWFLVTLVAAWQWWYFRRRTYAVFAVIVTVHLAALFPVAPHMQFRFVEGAVELAQLAVAAAIAVSLRRSGDSSRVKGNPQRTIVSDSVVRV